ncbi:MAG: HDOD domain-containing protein [Ghiorsea sp.]
MLYIIGLLIFGGVVWVFWLKPSATDSKLTKRKKTKKLLDKNIKKPQNYFQFDVSSGGAELATNKPTKPASEGMVTEFKQHLDSIPTLPTVWPDLLSSIEREESARHVASLIKSEPTLAVEVLRYANMQAAKEISDLGQAIVMLGYNAVRGIVTRYCVSNIKVPSDTYYNIGELWRHAIATSALASIVAKYIPNCDSGVAGTLGLLHDIGRIGVNIALAPRQQTQADHSLGYLYFERETFGVNHLDAGGLLAKHWLLSDMIQEGIIHHHHPAFSEPESIPEQIRKEVLAVYLADILAIHFGFKGGHKFITLPLPSYGNLLSASLEDIMADQAVSKELRRVKAINL